MFQGFDELFGKELQKVAHFVETRQKSSIWPRLASFRETIMFRSFEELFGKKLQNVADFVKKHEKSSIWPKLATFRANYHVSMF